MADKKLSVEEVAKNLKGILDYVRDCQARVTKGEIMNLEGLDDNVMKICDAIAKLPEKEGKDLEDQMGQLIEALEGLARNISNADTPNFKPQDVAPLDFKSMLESSSSKISLQAASGLSTTKSNHISLGSTSGSTKQPAVKAQKDAYETSPSGNAVILEEQLLKMNQNFTDHRLTTTIYQKNVDLMKAAIK